MEFNAIFRDSFTLWHELTAGSKIRDPITAKFKHVTVIVTCTLPCCDDVTYVPALWNFQKAAWNPTLTAKNTPLFLFPYMGHSLQIFAWEIPYMLMYSALHIMQWFYGCLDVFTPKIRRKFFDFNILWIKTNVAYTRLEVVAKQRSALQVEFITGPVKLICYFVLYYCFLQWDHLPNMAVGDLAFFFILYIYGMCLWVLDQQNTWLFLMHLLTTFILVPTCPENDFQCGNLFCVKQSARCDGINDCLDATDEKQCGEWHFLQ